MISKDQIRKNIQNDPYWEPDEDATHEEWEVFDEVCEELDKLEGVEEEDDDDSDWSEDEE